MGDTGGRPLDIIAAPSIDAAQLDLGLARAANMFRRRLWVVALVACVVFMGMVFKTATTTRLYTAMSQVQIDVRETRVFSSDQSVVSALPPTTQVVDTETQIIQSRTLAGRVVDALRLTEDREFAPAQRFSLKDQFRTLIDGRTPAKTAFDLARERNDAREATITALQNRVRVSRLGLTYIIEIEVTSMDPKKAELLADKFADLYLTQQLETKYDTIARANEWLSNRLESLRQEVQVKEKAVETYRAQNGLLSAEGSTLTEQSIAAANTSLMSSRADLAEKQARLRSLEQGVAAGSARAEATSEALASPVIASLRAQQSEIARQGAEMRTKYGPKHPDILKNQQESADIDKRIDQEVQRVVASMRNDVEVSRQRVAAIESNMGLQQSDLAANNVGAVKLREVERDADASRTLYEAFLNRFKQVAEQSGIEQPDARVVSRATPGKLTTPNTKLNLMLGLVLGVALGAVAAFVLEIFEQSLRSAQDVQDRLGVACFGSIPFLDKKTRLVDGELVPAENFVLKRPLSAFGESLRSIRASVFFSSPDRKVKVLVITSALPEEGKTTTAVGLARISALAGSKTVLVDCDLRRRSTTHSMGIEVDKGLTEVLFKTAELDEVIVKDVGSGCDVVPLAQPEFTPRDLFSSEAMRQLIETLRSRYEVVILDTAPIMPLADTRVLAPLADTVLFVTRWGRTPASIVRSAMDQLRAHGANIAGLVLEGVETSMMSRLLYDGPDQYSELYQTYYIR